MEITAEPPGGDLVPTSRNRKSARRLLSACAALIFIAMTGAAAYQMGEHVGIRSLEQVAAHQLEVFKASFFSPIEKYEYLPALLAAHPVIIEGLLDANDGQRVRRLNAFLESSSRTAGSAAIYLMDRTGMTIASSNHRSTDSFVGTSFAFRPYFQEAMRGRLGRFYGIGAITREPGYFLAYGVSHGGRYIGVLSVKVDLNAIDAGWQYGGEQITVTDENGIIFLSSNPEWKYRATQPLSPEVLLRLQTTRQYSTMLKSPIGFLPHPTHGNEKIVSVNDPMHPGRRQRYLTKSYELPDAKWTVTTYSPTHGVANRGMEYGFIAAGGAAFLVLLGMYVLQFRKRMAEREAAKKAAELAHQQLEAKHRELEKLSEHLRTMAISDALTGCFNRRHFLDTSAKMTSAARRYRRSVSVLMLDIDFFKKINDTWGHPAGDEVLKAVAKLCQATLREPDFLARFGGEEFVVILPDTSTEEALVVAERVRAGVELLKVAAAGTELSVTVSIGLSQFIETETSIEKALSRADMALYRAKRMGRNQVIPYVPDMAAEETARTVR